MNWLDDTISLVRFIIGDFGSCQTYTDRELQDLIFGAARFVIFDLSFVNQYTVNIQTSSITPSPEDDYDFQTLIALKAAYLILSSEFKFYSAQSAVVTDGPSTINITTIAAGYKQRMQDISLEYNKAKLQYAIGNGIGGQSVQARSCNHYWGWTGNFGYWRDQYPIRY